MAGSGVHKLGYFYLFTPVLVNVAIILSVALLFNYLFHWRRYPAALMQYKQKDVKPDLQVEESLSRDDIEHALRQMNQFVDVGPEELGKIYQLARNRNTQELQVDQIKLGLYYSNGKYGADWAVRQVVDESGKSRSDQDQVIYKVVAGKNRRGSGTMTREQFAQWARYEVFLNENSWQRVPLLAEPVLSAVS
jgi:CBS-domain-containing membrane protein